MQGMLFDKLMSTGDIDGSCDVVVEVEGVC